jgi:hypothetical protein
MKRCHCCQERFGLIRHHYDRRQFCSAICVASYRATLRQAAKDGLCAARPPISASKTRVNALKARAPAPQAPAPQSAKL